MSDKPWSNESTPIMDRENGYCGKRTKDYDGVYVESARNLERRMRAAEQLVAEVIAGYEAERDADFDWIEWYERAKAHLEAARMEDKQ